MRGRHVAGAAAALARRAGRDDVGWLAMLNSFTLFRNCVTPKSAN
jgi:hypothetical protein